ncbi:NAD(P)-binding protein [bacterium]|nr:NAD(P)-binding protein [bacterium]
MGEKLGALLSVGARHKCADAVCVVGAGFSGVMAAYRLALSGYPVCLVDLSRRPGGVMQDDFIESRPHLSGCHLIQQDVPEAYGFKLPAKDQLVSSPNQVSSWTRSSTGIQRESNVEGPISCANPLDWNSTGFSRPNRQRESLGDRLQAYPDEVRLELLQWTTSLGLDSDRLHQDSLEALQLRRVYFPSRYRDVLQELKNQDSKADELFGVAPRDLRQVLIAKNGYSRWFEAAVVELMELGVHYRPGAAAKPSIRSGQIRLELDGESFTPPLGFWCANPNPLGKALMPGVRWDGQSKLLTAWHVEVDQGADSALSYVQFFGHPYGVIRATKYQFGGIQRVVVESLASTRRAAGTAAPSVLEAAQETGAVPRALLGNFTRRSYLTMSVTDSHHLQEMGQRLNDLGWIHSGLQYFSRPRKLAWLDEEIRNRAVLTDETLE